MATVAFVATTPRHRESPMPSYYPPTILMLMVFAVDAVLAARS